MDGATELRPDLGWRHIFVISLALAGSACLTDRERLPPGHPDGTAPAGATAEPIPDARPVGENTQGRDLWQVQRPGRLEPSKFIAAVRAHDPALMACLDAGRARRPALEGTVQVVFLISASGSVEDVRLDRSSLDDTETLDCVVSLFRTLRFPAPDGGRAAAAYGFHYDPSRASSAMPDAGAQ